MILILLNNESVYVWVILSINKIYRQKKLAVLVAVDSSSKKASPKQRLLLIIYKLISFRGLCQSLFHLWDIEGRVEVLLPIDEELPMYSSLLRVSVVNFWSAQQLGIAAQRWKFKIINFPLQQVFFFSIEPAKELEK